MNCYYCNCAYQFRNDSWFITFTQNHNLLFMFTILYIDLFRSWGEDNFIKSKNDQYVKIWMKISSRISEFMILSDINIYL